MEVDDGQYKHHINSYHHFHSRYLEWYLHIIFWYICVLLTTKKVSFSIHKTNTHCYWTWFDKTHAWPPRITKIHLTVHLLAARKRSGRLPIGFQSVANWYHGVLTWKKMILKCHATVFHWIDTDQVCRFETQSYPKSKTNRLTKQVK